MKLETYLAERYEETLRNYNLELDLAELEKKLNEFDLTSPLSEKDQQVTDDKTNASVLVHSLSSDFAGLGASPVFKDKTVSVFSSMKTDESPMSHKDSVLSHGHNNNETKKSLTDEWYDAGDIDISNGKSNSVQGGVETDHGCMAEAALFPEPRVLDTTDTESETDSYYSALQSPPPESETYPGGLETPTSTPASQCKLYIVG